MSQTDFNDLHVSEGLDVVRDQVTKAIESAKAKPAANDMPAYDEGGYGDYPEADYEQGNSSDSSSAVRHAEKFTIETLIRRYHYAMPNGKIWDSAKKVLVKKVPFRELVGAELFKEWLNSDHRRVVDENDVKREAQAAKKEGRGGLSAALERYVYLYPETSVWDADKRKIVGVNGLKVAIADCYDDWIKDPRRKEIDIENLVFDPTQKVDPATHINMFRGLAIDPADDAEQCKGIVKMMWFLCNHDKEVFHWLGRWLAYPLQNVGAKMASAVMMHSEIQGSGKSLFFDVVLRGIYGEYSATLGQHQLESQYTDWRSQMLYGVFEEIFSRDQKYSHTGTLKQMITGETMRIEKKFVSGWEEANHMNAVFLSNEIQPFPVEASDRRMLVIWPEGKLDHTLRDQVIHEIANGGSAAFFRHLLNIPLGDFNTHSEPPMTEAKERLIDFGRSGWDSFYREWQIGALEVPYSSCLMGDLYKVYQRWCRMGNEKILSLKAFSAFLSVPSRGRRRPDLHYQIGVNKRKGTFLIIGQQPDEPPMTQGVWLGKCVEAFQKGMRPDHEE